jgi:DNA-binding FadR family transcriptional regulator
VTRVDGSARPALVSEQVFRTLLESLLSGAYAPGERLPTQRALAADLGVTMGPLREALKRLEQMRLIESRQGDAMRVRDWRVHGGLDVVAHLLALGSEGIDAKLLLDVFEARGTMLRELATLAARRRDDERAARLGELARAVAEAPDAAAAQRVDFEFFTELAHATGNLLFVLILNSIRSMYFARAEQLLVTADHEELAPLYAEAADAVARRDEAAAGRAVAELAELQRARVEALLGLS